MLSLRKTSAGSDYHEQKLQTDYLTKGERPSQWMGSGAEQLGLSGPVDPTVFRNLFQGLTPDGAEPLVSLKSVRKDRQYVPGHDQVFSAPKSVSVAWALFDELKGAIETAQWSAVKKAIAFEEEHAALTRRGKGGRRLERCGLIVAAVQEGYGRNGDPQVHTHAFTLHAVAHSTGFGTLESKRLYDLQIATRRVYLASLAEGLQALGFTLEAVEARPFELGDSFRIQGMPQRLCGVLSSRRAEILSATKELGVTTARGAELVALATRRAKVELSESEVRERARAIAESLGYDGAEIRRAVLQPTLAKAERDSASPIAPDEDVQSPGRSKPSENTRPFPAGFEPLEAEVEAMRPTERLRKVGDEPTPAQPANPPREAALRLTADENAERLERTEPTENLRPFPAGSDSLGVGAESERPIERPQRAGDEIIPDRPEIPPRVAASILESLVRSAEANRLPARIWEGLIDGALEEADRKWSPGRGVNESTRTAQAAQALTTVFAIADNLSKDKRHLIHPDAVKGGVAGRLTGRPEDQALTEVLMHTGAVACVEASAGVDEGLFVKAMAREYKRSGFKVQAFAGQVTAASELESISGVETRTVSQLLHRLDPPKLDVAKHHLRQILRTAMSKPAYGFERWRLKKDAIVVVTQSQSLRTTELARLAAKVQAAGAKLVLMGDPRQVQRREPHNAFREVSERVGKVTLPEAPRQAQEWMADAVRQVARGDVKGALSQYALAERLHVAADHRTAMIDLAAHWKGLPKEDRQGRTLIVAGSARDARALNKLAQRAQRERGALGIWMWQRVDGAWVYRGDRLLFRMTSKHYGYRAGDRGTIERIGLSSMTLRLDRQRSFLGLKRHVRVQVPKKLYRGLTMGYAVSAADAQGVSAERALVLPRAGTEDPSGLLVQLSRAREDTRVFAGVRTVGPQIEAIDQAVRLQPQTTQTRDVEAARIPAEEGERKRLGLRV